MHVNFVRCLCGNSKYGDVCDRLFSDICNAGAYKSCYISGVIKVGREETKGSVKLHVPEIGFCQLRLKMFQLTYMIF